MKNFKLKSIFVVVLSVVILTTGCSPKSKPEDNVINCFKSIQQGKISEIDNYMVESDDLNTEIAKKQDTIFNEALKKVEYEILDTTIDGDTAVVKTKVTAPDMTDLMAQLLNLSVMSIIAGEDIESEEFNKKVKETIDLDKLEMKATEVSINMKKQDGEWLIDGGDELLNAITGNMLKAMEDYYKNTKEE